MKNRKAKLMALTIYTNIGFTAIVYAISYGIKTFIIWKVTNPFQWIIDIPKETPETRIVYLCFWTIYEAFVIGMSYESSKKTIKKLEEANG